MEEKLNHHTWSLSDPGMDLLERAGLAGLYMALLAAADSGHDLSPLQWTEADLTIDSVTVRWSGAPKAAFQKLIEWAWQVRDGVLYFPAIHNGLDASNWHLRVPMHNGIMRTFLQHTNVQPKGPPTTRVVQLDDEKQFAVTYQPPIIREPKPRQSKGAKVPAKPKKTATKPRSLLKPHRDYSEFLFCGESVQCPVTEPIKWLTPGMAGRYGDETNWIGPSDRALLLMLAPTVCLYLKLPKTKVTIKGSSTWVDNWVLAVSDIRDLVDFAARRCRLHLLADFVDAASLGDAGLRFLAEFSSLEPRKDMKAGCRVVAMGNVTYYANQKVRKSVLDVPAKTGSIRRYRRLHEVLPNPFQRRRSEPEVEPPKRGRGKRKPDPLASSPQGNGWYKLPTGRGRIADNLVAGRPWYRDLFVPLPWDEKELEDLRSHFKFRDSRSYSRETTWFLALCQQRSKLMRLITEDDMWDTEAEKVFVQVVWETLDSLYAQERDAVARGGSATYEKRCDRLNGEIYRSLIQAKTPILLRSVLSGLFAKAGRQKTIFAHAAAVWRLIDHPNHWQKGRDLALLAFASYPEKNCP